VNPIEKLKGEQLSAVTFVHDYVQLHFDGPLMNVYAPVTVCAGGRSDSSGGSEFRNAICAQIAKEIASTEWGDESHLKLSFTDKSSISISLNPSDYSGPEALYFHGYDQTLVI
jgi:hypothetical protein